jgi:hypothetical protein
VIRQRRSLAAYRDCGSVAKDGWSAQESPIGHRSRQAFVATLSLVGIGALMIAPLVHGEVEQPATISTDRPAVAESSVVVPRGGLQVETGVLESALQGQHVLDLPEADIRYGVLDRLEFRITAPDYYGNLPVANGSASGASDSALGIKQQLGPISGLDLSIIGYVSFPTGASQISSHGHDPAVQLPWSRSLSASWTAAGQIATYWPTVGGKHGSIREGTFLFDRQLSSRADAFIEYAADFPQGGAARQILHAGAAYRAAPHHQIDLHAGAGLSASAPRAFVGVGYSFLLLAH